MNRRTLKTEKLLSSSPSRKSALTFSGIQKVPAKPNFREKELSRRNVFFGGFKTSADRRRGQRKGATSKNVKTFSICYTFFVQDKKCQKPSKSFKNKFRHFSTIFARHHFLGPLFLGGSETFSLQSLRPATEVPSARH